MTGYSYEEIKNRSVESLFTEDTRYRLRACKQRIVESIVKSQVIRTEDKQLPAVIIDSSGKQIGVVAVLVCLSAGPEEKMGL